MSGPRFESNVIHVDRRGSGAPVVLLHGWGLHGGVFARTAAFLAQRHRVISVDLPGFGASTPLASHYSAEALAAAVTAVVPENAVWVGWSLGGLVALSAVTSGVPVKKLVLVGATPRFVQGESWPHAMGAEVLEGFAAALEQDYRATVLRFLALQARGCEHAREELRSLRETVFARGEPSLQALRGGLGILRTTDMREKLAQVIQPALVIQGERDVLVPIAAAQATARALPKGRLALIPGAGHAPFLSHPDLFERELSAFLHE